MKYCFFKHVKVQCTEEGGSKTQGLHNVDGLSFICCSSISAYYGHIMVSTFFFLNYKPCFIGPPIFVDILSFSPVRSPESGIARSKNFHILHFDRCCQIESIYTI